MSTWLTRDHSQSIRLRTDAAGALAEASQYLAYGAPAPPPPGALHLQALHRRALRRRHWSPCPPRKRNRQ